MDWVNKEQLEHFYWEKFWIATVSPAAVLTKVLEKNKENAWPLPQQSHLDHSGGGRGAFTVPSTVRMRSHVLFKWWEIRRPGCWADLDTSQTSSLLPHWTHRLQGKTPPQNSGEWGRYAYIGVYFLSIPLWQLCSQIRWPSYLQLHFMALLVKSLSATS